MDHILPESPYSTKGTDPLEAYPARVMDFNDIVGSPEAFRCSHLVPFEWPKRTFDHGIMLGVENMARHMTNEGHLLQQGVQAAGLPLCGPRLRHDTADVFRIMVEEQPDFVITQDRREWHNNGNFHDPCTEFQKMDALTHADVARFTIFKDAGSDITTQHAHQQTLRPHGLITYYHDQAVRRLAPWTAQVSLFRTYHCVDAASCPLVMKRGHYPGAILTGATDPKFYPLRAAAARWVDEGRLRNTTWLHHPGYHAKGSATPVYLSLINRFKVHVATASRFGFASRKIIESVACGCTPVTTLPAEDILPEIDDALVRVPHNITAPQLQDVLREAEADWDYDRIVYFAGRAKAYYDYRSLYQRLASQLKHAVKTGNRP